MYKKIIFLIMIMMFALSGCGIESELEPTATVDEIEITPGPTEAPEDNTPVDGGTLRSAVAQYNTLNPLSTNNEDIKYFMSLVFEPLLKLDIEQKAIPCLSESWTKSEDGLHWIFQIRQGIKWQDGDPFTCQDVKLTIDWVRSTPNNYSANVSNIESCNILNDQEIEIVLKTKDAFMINKMAFPILKGGTGAASGTGMYSIESETPEKLVLTKNIDWWGSEKPHIEKLDITRTANEDEKSALDTDLTFLFNDFVKKYSAKEGHKVYKNHGRIYTMLAINTRTVQDANIRKALSCILDKTAVLNASASGHALSTDWPVYPGTIYWRDGSVFYMTSSKNAEEYLNRAGYTKENGGWYNNGSLLSFVVTVPDTTEMRLCGDELKKQYEHFGIPVELNIVSKQNAVNMYHAGQYSLGLMQFTLSSWPEIQNIVTTNGAYNIFGYTSTEVDDSLNSLADLETAAQCEKLQGVQGQLNGDEPFIGLYIKADAIVISNALVGPGLTGITVWDPMWAFNKWFIRETGE